MAGKEGEKVVAGAFFADDQIIWDVVSCDSTTIPAFTQEKTTRKFKLDGHSEIATTSLTFEQCLAVALEKIAEEVVRNGAPLDALCVAMPGPMRGSGLGVEAITLPHHRMGEGWSNKYPYEYLEAAIKKLPRQGIVGEHMPFALHTDAEAYCVGDYHIEVRQFPSKKPHKVFAHIVVDEGIGGALVVHGKLLETGFHSEIGHSMIRRHKLDEAFDARCAAHHFVGCPESYVSLSALRRRWGDDADKTLRHWGSDREEVHLIAYYLAQVCVNLIVGTNATAIRFSGRAVRNQAIIDKIAEYVRALLTVPGKEGEYFPGVDLNKAIGRRNDVDAGIYGCIVLAHQQALAKGQGNG